MWASNWDSARRGHNIDLEQWGVPLRDAGVQLTGHTLTERSCWGFEDVWHPSEAGHRVVAEVLADAMAGGATPGSILRSTPRCSAVLGIGPGKAGSPAWSD